MEITLIYIGLGCVIGIILALTGAGGGVIGVPLLAFGAHLSIVEAAPIGLTAVFMATTLGAVLGLKAKTVRYKSALLMASAGMLLSPFGLWLAHRIDNRWLSMLFGIIILFVAYRIFRQAQQQPNNGEFHVHGTPPCIRDADTGRFQWTSSCAGYLALSGAAAGFLSGLLGVGGGFVIVPALQRYTDLTMASVVATSLAVMALISITVVATSAMTGHFNWMAALPFSTGALVGVLSGRLIARKLAHAHMQKIFALLLLLVALIMISKPLIH
jgi:uncharacterized membrane protein YfcA